MAIIFGSFARGDRHKWSDLDIMLVSGCFEGKTDNERDDMVGLELHEELGYCYPLDILCFSRNEYTEKSEHVSVVREATREGIYVLR